jgi:hypothetical protein
MGVPFRQILARAFPLAPFAAIASLSSERNAVNKLSAVTINRLPWWCAAALSFVGYPLEVRLSEPEVAFFGRPWGFRFARRKKRPMTPPTIAVPINRVNISRVRENISRV